MKDLGVGYGIFRIMTEPIEIDKVMIINMGETYMVLTTSFSNDDETRYEESKSLSEFLNSARKSDNSSSFKKS